MSSEETVKIKEYIENNINEFAIIDESNSQVSYVDRQIMEIETLEKEIEDANNERIIIEKYIKDNMSKFAINDKINCLEISESAVFGKNGTSISILITNINGKRVTIKIKKDNEE